MKHYLFITIDTEEDLWGEYTVKNPPLENIKKINMMQKIFDKHSAIPTYLLNYPVACDSYSIELFCNLLKRGKCDIGAHCHPWNNPPFVNECHLEQNSFMCNLSEELVLQKITQLSDSIKNNFHFTPIVFRAGRWGIGENVLKVLQKLGYKIDTSITPFINGDKYFGPKYLKKSNLATGMIGIDNLCSEIEKNNDFINTDYCIVEIPPTIGFTQSNFQLCHKVRTILKKTFLVRFRLLGVLDRLGMLNCRMLSPEFSNLGDMVKLSKIIMSKGHRFLNMSFHSTSLLPGKSPFVKDDYELNLFLRKIDKYLELMTKEGVECIGMSRALEVLA